MERDGWYLLPAMVPLAARSYDPEFRHGNGNSRDGDDDGGANLGLLQHG